MSGVGLSVKYQNLHARETTQQKIVQETDATVIHPYDDFWIVAGQATAALELLQEQPELDLILAPAGGGGLLFGTALAAHYFGHGTLVIGVEPDMADDIARSIAAGHIIPSVSPWTITDGLLTSLGERNFPILRELVHSIVTVSEESMISAMKFIWERTKLIIDPSAAVPIAALMNHQIPPHFRNIGVILSGGNVDLETLPWQKHSWN